MAEVRAITGLNVIAKNLDILEIQSLHVEEVAKAKALSAFKAVGKPVIVDDTGMSIDALGGLPGALVAWFLDSLRPAGILRLMANEKNRSCEIEEIHTHPITTYFRLKIHPPWRIYAEAVF